MPSTVIAPHDAANASRKISIRGIDLILVLQACTHVRRPRNHIGGGLTRTVIVRALARVDPRAAGKDAAAMVLR